MSGFNAPAGGANSYPPRLADLTPLGSGAAFTDVAAVADAEQDASDSDGRGVADLLARRRERQSLPRDERDAVQRNAAETEWAARQNETAMRAHQTFQSSGGEWQAQAAPNAGHAEQANVPESSVAELREQRAERRRHGFHGYSVHGESTPMPASWAGFDPQ
ncbi:hypothetical protein [Nocardia sp. NPDC059239]|uniref:hypothetical protein n=1 Tax=unclassified Nocardia TaxID=2637762 RepID=UPI0036C16609